VVMVLITLMSALLVTVSIPFLAKSLQRREHTAAEEAA
jgi:hypothetical protein